MKSALDASHLHQFFHKLFTHLDRVSLSAPSGEILYSKGLSSIDHFTLPQAGSVANQFFNLGHGDLAITNDPYSGSAELWSPTLIMGLQLKTSSKASRTRSVHQSFLLSYRKTLMPFVSAKDNIDSEGLRIPPTPLGQISKPQTETIDAITSHPQAPKQLRSAIEDGLAELEKVSQTLPLLLKIWEVDLTKGTTKPYLKASEDSLKELIADLTSEEKKFSLEIEPGEVIRLKLSVKNDRVLFDFLGTTAGSRIFQTLPVTHGACAEALIKVLNAKQVPVNSGTLSCIEVLAPKGCLVNADYPKPSNLTHLDGYYIFCDFLLKSLQQMTRRVQYASSGTSRCAISLQFSCGQIFYDSVPPGSGGTKEASGANGESLWWKRSGSPSIESIEKKFPLMYEASTLRGNSYGSGLNPGGLGVAKSIRLLEPATVYWNNLKIEKKPEGADGGKAALNGEILVVHPSGEKVKLIDQGEMRLEKNTLINLLGPGGGGFSSDPKV